MQLDLPETREEITQWALTESGYHISYVNRIIRNVSDYNRRFSPGSGQRIVDGWASREVTQWAWRIGKKYPDLFDRRATMDSASIYIANILIGTYRS
jgi:hypothetical protein